MLKTSFIQCIISFPFFTCDRIDTIPCFFTIWFIMGVFFTGKRKEIADERWRIASYSLKIDHLAPTSCVHNLPHCTCKLVLVTWNLSKSGHELTVSLALNPQKTGNTWFVYKPFFFLPRKIASDCDSISSIIYYLSSLSIKGQVLSRSKSGNNFDWTKINIHSKQVDMVGSQNEFFRTSCSTLEELAMLQLTVNWSN